MKRFIVFWLKGGEETMYGFDFTDAYTKNGYGDGIFCLIDRVES